MDWHDLLTAFALYLVLEGIIPFLNPAGFKGIMANMLKLPDATLRKIGGAGMAAGMLLLYFARQA